MIAGLVGRAAALFLALALCGCALIPEGASLPPSAMRPSYTQFRADLDVKARPVDRPPYRPVSGCTYRAFGSDIGGRDGDRPVELSVKAVRERLLVSISAESRISTALIGEDGRMFDFSLAVQGAVANPETWASLARQRAASSRGAGREDAHVVNELSLIVPHYLPARFEPGATAAILANQDGGIWARHVYRGTTQFAGRNALLFDLLAGAASPSAEPDRLIGFALVDSASMIPVALILDTGPKLRFEQLGCR